MGAARRLASRGFNEPAPLSHGHTTIVPRPKEKRPQPRSSERASDERNPANSRIFGARWKDFSRGYFDARIYEEPNVLGFPRLHEMRGAAGHRGRKWTFFLGHNLYRTCYSGCAPTDFVVRRRSRRRWG
jgi:hypothetical protein